MQCTYIGTRYAKTTESLINETAYVGNVQDNIK